MTSTIQFPAVVIGLMSGTSADGVDAAILRTDGREIVEAGASHFVAYDAGLRADILGLMRGVGDEAAIAKALTDVHITAVKELMAKAGLGTKDVALIGFHGQTIRHAPHEGITVQIGEPARMARALGIPVVADFRTADVKAGGQGAPLVPLYHAALAHALPKPVMVVNIGGVSNATWIGANGEIIGFDIGPGNALIDDWVSKHTGERCDRDGELAARGVVDSTMVAAFLRDPFFLLDAPKSLDRHHFEELVQRLLAERNLSVEDGAATLASMTATAIALSFGCVPAAPHQVLITGGGRRNPYLMNLLTSCVNAAVLPVEAVGWDGDMLEAQAFAYLAARSVQGLPLSLPSTTGVKTPCLGGKFYCL